MKITFFSLTKDFIKMSRQYIGPFKLKDYLYFPIAYIKFMFYSYRDMFRLRKS